MHETFFARAFELASMSRGACSPNPNVGAVIVSGGRIIGEGRTQPCGQDHAEVQALKSVSESPAGADLYVTLEPCCHHGKTPPCTDAIIASGIRRVFIGIQDPNPKVDGKGIARLMEAGIQVETGFMQEQIGKQLEAYLHWIRRQRPFVVLKTASSLDGRVAARDGSSRWITGEAARQDVHRLRGEADAILTGIGTVLHDDPRLTCRMEAATRQPLRVVLDTRLRTPVDGKLLETADQAPLLIVHDCDDTVRSDLLANRAELLRIPATDGRIPLRMLLGELYRRGIQTILVEAGPSLAGSLLRERLIDKWVAYQAPAVLGDGLPIFAGLEIPDLGSALHFKTDSVERIGDDVRIVAYPRYERITLRSANAGLSRLMVKIP